MKPHPRIRKTIKWGGAVVVVLLFTLWVGSKWWLIWVQGEHYGLSLFPGGFNIVRRELAMIPEVGSHSREGFGGFDGLWCWWFGGATAKGNVTLFVPLWVVILPVLIATVFAWRCDTKARCERLNLCPKCGYDRDGIARDAKCPECGSVAS